MKKAQILTLVSLGFFLASPVSADSGFSKNLYFGIQGDPEVIKLQEFLTSEGIYSGPISGNFFSLTLQGVKDFQARENISPVAGYFGPLTRTRANEFLGAQISASDQQAISETGSLPEPVIAPKTTNDVASGVQSQLDALLQQVALLQQQLQAQQQTQQTFTAETLASPAPVIPVLGAWGDPSAQDSNPRICRERWISVGDKQVCPSYSNPDPSVRAAEQAVKEHKEWVEREVKIRVGDSAKRLGLEAHNHKQEICETFKSTVSEILTYFCSR